MVKINKIRPTFSKNFATTYTRLLFIPLRRIYCGYRVISGTQTEISSSNPCNQRLLELNPRAQPNGTRCNLVLLSLFETRRRNKDKEKRRVLPRSRIALFSSCTFSTQGVYTYTHRANTYTHPVRALSRIRVRVRNQFPLSLFSFFLHLFLPFSVSLSDTRPTCKSCRDLVYLRDSRFPTTGVFPPTKLDRPLSGRFFSSRCFFSFFFSSFFSLSLSFSLVGLGREIDRERSIIMSFFFVGMVMD